MLDAVVQLLRNGLCCIKNLHLFEKTFLWDSSIPPKYYDLPEPLSHTTPLEVLISIFQLYALISCTRGGLSMMSQSFGKLRRLGSIIEYVTSDAAITNATKKNDDTCDNPLALTSDRIVQQSLMQEANNAIRSLVTGFLVFFIGCGFVWLVANSWHVTSTDWLGGTQGLIHALSVQEICLLPCLYFMIAFGQTLLSKAKRMERLVRTLRGQKKLTPTQLGVEELELFAQYTPAWEAGVSAFESHNAAADEKLVAAEKERIERCLQELEKKSPQQVFDMADDLVAAARVTRMEGYREFLYFLINLSAFYGYMMGIVCYYWQEEVKHPTWVKSFLLNMTIADADWRGNMTGDMAWTIEPIVILTSPFLLASLKPTKRESRKVKAD
ncbi:hypothetical protein MPSEU_000141900 [Mayamaea pseudoterrestris]|nr:hypothetical protein MPSEU_000141900 [Mayamaea pseudoterrestris]